MEAFKKHTGIVAILDRANVDTDQIIPKQFLKSIRRTGFGEALFFDWRYLPDGTPDPKFELNDPQLKGASILVARNNFGCGSSREHAVWAVVQYGFKVVIAPSVRRGKTRVSAFADIFRNNSAKNGLLTIELSESEVDDLFKVTAQHKGFQATVDLEQQQITLHVPQALSFHFAIDAAVKDHLLRGLDEIGLTLQCVEEINAFEKKHDTQMVVNA
jgi:3-isopropylmalate/(R)-2-methylmalate dehydratase small subunit